LDRELCNLLSESALQRASSARLSLEVAVEPQSLLAFYRIPMVSFVMRGWAHLVGMALCGLQIALSTSTEEVAQREMEIALGLHDDGAKAVPALSATELAQFVNVAALVLDNLLATVDAEAALLARSTDLLRGLEVNAHRLFLASYVLRIASTLVVDPSTARLLYEIFGFSLAVYSTILSVGLLRLFSRASRPFGVLVIAIDRMIRSIDMYLLFSTILMLSAGFAFFGLSRVDGYVPPANDYAVNRHSWYMLPAFAFIAPPFAAIDEFKGGAALFMHIYLIFTTKVLTSLIMAIFATAHSRVFNDAENEYVYESHKALFEYRHVHLRLPPPLNLPIVVVGLLSHVARRGWVFASSSRSTPEERRSLVQARCVTRPSRALAQLQRQQPPRISIAPFVDSFMRAEAVAHERGSLESLGEQMNAFHHQQQQQHLDLKSDVSARVTELHGDMSERLAAIESCLRGNAPRSGGFFGLTSSSSRPSNDALAA